MGCMKAVDKNEIVNMFDEINERHFLAARLETLMRIRKNLQNKIAEIDSKISDLKKEFSSHELKNFAGLNEQH